MNSDWNPANAPTWCRLSGNLPSISGNVVVVVDESSEKVSAFFEAELPSLPENLEARLLKLPKAPKPDEILGILRNTLSSLFPEIGTEFSTVGPAKWGEAVRKQREISETNDRWLLIDSFHNILKAPVLERKIFAHLLQQLSEIPSFGVIIGITTDSAIETAALLNLMDQQKPRPMLIETATTAVETPVAAAPDFSKEVARFEKVQIGRAIAQWTAAACLALSLGVGTYVLVSKSKNYHGDTGNSVAFGTRPATVDSRNTTTLAEVAKTTPTPLTTAVVQQIEPSGHSLPTVEIRPMTKPEEKAADFDVDHLKQKWEFSTEGELPGYDVQYFVAEAYCFGHGVEKDLKKGIEMLNTAYKNGSEKAANLLGTCYSRGHGVEQDYRRAHELLNIAVNRGSFHAYGNLGVLYLRGLGCDVDPVRAREYFLKGAKAGDPVAAYFAAKCFEDGIGTEHGEREPELAVQWYLEAADKGHDEAIAWCRAHKLMPAPAPVTIRF